MANETQISYTKAELENFYKEFSTEEINNILNNNNGDDFLKIFSILNIEKINSQKEMDVILKHLSNHTTPIREAVSFKLGELSINFSNYLLNDLAKEQLLKAIVDINPNVSRIICEIISNNKKIQILLKNDIVLNIENLLEKIKLHQKETNDYCDTKKNHTKNKLLFALYWNLEAFACCFDGKIDKKIENILSETMNFFDYTIREKTAKIIAKTSNPPEKLLQIAKSDLNFYVKNQVCDKIIKD